MTVVTIDAAGKTNLVNSRKNVGEDEVIVRVFVGEGHSERAETLADVIDPR